MITLTGEDFNIEGNEEDGYITTYPTPNAVFNDDVEIADNVGDVIFEGKVKIYGSFSASSGFGCTVNGSIYVQGDCSVDGDFTVNGGKISVTGDLSCGGSANAGSTVRVKGNAEIGQLCFAGERVLIGKSLACTGVIANSVIYCQQNINASEQVTFGSYLIVKGNLTSGYSIECAHLICEGDISAVGPVTSMHHIECRNVINAGDVSCTLLMVNDDFACEGLLTAVAATAGGGITAGALNITGSVIVGGSVQVS